jgi:hypothetical protein
METKEQLVQQIKGWMANDNEIRDLQSRLKELKEKRKGYSDNLYTKTKVKAPLNKNTLVTALMKYFKDDDDQAKELSSFLLESREEKVKESIRRKVQK